MMNLKYLTGIRMEPNYQMLYEAAVFELELLRDELARNKNRIINLNKMIKIQTHHLLASEKEIKELKKSAGKNTET